ILGVMCDNASNNDAMVQEMMSLVDRFASPSMHTWCFLHIINLVAKTLLHQFD
ncbi:hypothetical protein OG21DRAFT_1377879, partial [Imleria badia]